MNKVNIIIPVYNMEKYLEIAVNSVLEHTFKNIDVILVDDGSKDNSPLICDMLEHKYDNVKAIHQRNRGVSVARNTGIEYVLSNHHENETDEYIGFLDADDFWVNKNRLNGVENENADIIIFSSCRCNNKGNRFNIYHQFKNEELDWSKGSSQWIINGHPGAFFCNVNLIKKYDLRFMEDVRISEDIIYLRKATFCASKIITREDILYAYRYNDFSVLHTQDKMNVSRMNDTSNAWNDAKVWIDNINDFSLEEKKRWYCLCESYAGTILLENIALLARNGMKTDELSNVLKNNPYYDQVLSLNEDYLAEWQKIDLRLLKNDLDEFVKYNGKIGKKERIRHIFSIIRFLRTLKDLYTFNMKSV